MDKIFVGNLNYETDEETLRAHFAAYGLDTGMISIPRDKESGRSRGFAFVEVTDKQLAIELLHNSELDGRSLRLDEARQQDNGNREARGNRRRF